MWVRSSSEENFSGREVFPLEWTWLLIPFSQNSFGWEYKSRSSLCTHAFHCTDSKDPDIHVLDGWMPARKTPSMHHPEVKFHQITNGLLMIKHSAASVQKSSPHCGERKQKKRADCKWWWGEGRGGEGVEGDNCWWTLLCLKQQCYHCGDAADTVSFVTAQLLTDIKVALFSAYCTRKFFSCGDSGSWDYLFVSMASWYQSRDRKVCVQSLLSKTNVIMPRRCFSSLFRGKQQGR